MQLTLDWIKSRIGVLLKVVWNDFRLVGDFRQTLFRTRIRFNFRMCSGFFLQLIRYVLALVKDVFIDSRYIVLLTTFGID